MSQTTAKFFLFLGITVLGITIAYPLIVLVLESVSPGLIAAQPSGFLSAWKEMWKTPGLGEMLWNSLAWGACTTFAAWVLGIPCGWMLARTTLPGKRWARILLLVPLMSPAYITALAYVLAMQPGGFVDVFVGQVPAWLRAGFFSFWGVTFVMVLASFGGVALAIEAVLRGIPARLEDAAEALGAGKTEIFFRVILPLIAPAVANSGILVFLDAISNFGVPVVLGPRANLPLLPAEIYAYATTWPVNLPLATALSVLLCIGALALLSLGRSLLSRHPVPRTRTVPHREHPLSALAAAGCWLWLITLAFFAALMPNAVVVATAFVGNWGAGGENRIRWTFENFREIFSATGGGAQALGTSLLLSSATATICVLLGALSAYGIHRAPGPLASLLDVLGMLPRMVPRIVTAIAFILAWNAPWIGIEIYNTIWLLLLAYFALYQSDSMRFADTGMRQIGVNVEQAAATLGAKPARIFFSILLPMLRPGLIAAWMTTFIVCMRDWVASIILLPPGVQTIGSYIFNQFDQGKIAQAMAMAACTVVVGSIVLVMLQLRGRK